MQMQTFRWLFFLLLLPVVAIAQPPTTRGTGSDSAGGTTPAPGGKTNILVVPLYPTLFNVDPDISRAMSKESGLKFDQIRDIFNKGLIDQLRKQFGPAYTVTSLLDDTVKMKADLKFVYANTSTAWTLVGAPLNPAPGVAAGTKPPPSGTKNGQVQAVTPDGDRFMNVRLLNQSAMDLMKNKYKAQYVIFINQVDLKNELGADPYNLNGAQVFKRMAVLHFTIYSTATGKRTAAGKVSSAFANTDNAPRVIIQKAYPSLVRQLVFRHQEGLKPVPVKTPGR